MNAGLVSIVTMSFFLKATFGGVNYRFMILNQSDSQFPYISRPEDGHWWVIKQLERSNILYYVWTAENSYLKMLLIYWSNKRILLITIRRHTSSMMIQTWMMAMEKMRATITEIIP